MNAQDTDSSTVAKMPTDKRMRPALCHHKAHTSLKNELK